MSNSAGNSLLKIAMPVASTLILIYYVVSLPMSFMGGGGGGESARSEAQLQVPMQSKVGIVQLPSPPVARVVNSSGAPPEVRQEPPGVDGTKGKDLGKSGKGQDPVSKQEVKEEAKKAGGTVKHLDPEKEKKQKEVSLDPVPILDVEQGSRDVKEQEQTESEENVSSLDIQELASQEDIVEQEREAEVDPVLGAGTGVFHSYEIFKKNYEQMMKKFKVFIYPDGDPDTYYQTPRKLTGKYASEGYFFQNLRESKFLTRNPNKAHLFFIPISCHKMRGKGISYERMTDIVQEYVEGLIAKYPYWNRTLGADHFFVTCHDVGARATTKVAHLVKNSIRVVCSPSYNGDFIPHKDVAMPQILQPFALPRGGNDVKNRTILGFWAGHRNSKIRVVLAKLWENDDTLAISNNRISRATGELVYQKQFYRSKFCICPGGSQVNSARIVDSIHYGCIPVILSDYYDLPFNDVLNWKEFALLLRERDVSELKTILQSIPQEKYLSLHKGLLQVQDRFEWHSPPKPYDAFYMVMYELWIRHFTVQYKK